MRLLARREHSARELSTKLARRGYPASTIEAELEHLASAGLQDDVRFAELFAVQRVERGDGPLKIRAALGDRGVDDSVIDAALAPFADDWLERARQVLARRFGSLPPDGRSEQARRLRFLQTRGFPAGIAMRAVDAGGSD